MNDIDRLRLYRDQIELGSSSHAEPRQRALVIRDGRVGTEVRREPVAEMAGGRETAVLAVAPIPTKRRLDCGVQP
jgi:hypothetical protein